MGVMTARDCASPQHRRLQYLAPRLQGMKVRLHRWQMLVLSAIVCLVITQAHAQTNVVIPWTTSHIQFLDATGVPLANACLYVYSAGTTSPAPTYSDSQGSVQNSNPVILDSGGFATIWLGTLSYKFIAYSKGTGGTQGTNCYSGTQQWSVDSIPGAGTSSGSVAFSSLTAAANANAGTFSTTGNTWDFTAATALKSPSSAGFAPTVSASFGYDTTANKWVFGQNGATKSFGIASAAACAANNFVDVPATAIAAAVCHAPSISGSTCAGCTINAASVISSSSLTSDTIASSTISASTLSGTITNSGTIAGGTISGATVTSPTIATGIAADGSGMKVISVTPCNPTAGATCNSTVTWNTPFADTSYAVFCTPNSAPNSGDIYGLAVSGIAANGFTLSQSSINGNYVTALIYCLGIHS